MSKYQDIIDLLNERGPAFYKSDHATEADAAVWVDMEFTLDQAEEWTEVGVWCGETAYHLAKDDVKPYFLFRIARMYAEENDMRIQDVVDAVCIDLNFMDKLRDWYNGNI